MIQWLYLKSLVWLIGGVLAIAACAPSSPAPNTEAIAPTLEPLPTRELETSTPTLEPSPTSATATSVPTVETVPADAVTLPQDPSSGSMEALLFGTLQADEVDNERCFWIKTEEERVVTVLWPVDIAGRWDPPRLVDQQGRIIATVGDEVELGGGFSTETELIPDICNVGDELWIASGLSGP
ncbi:MAG: hypothetical protein AAGF95_35595 [Chloroflexota bacterium]